MIRIQTPVAALLVVSACLASAPRALAISEVGYEQTYQQKVMPYYNSGKEGFFEGVGKVKISYRVFERENEKGAIVLIPGRSEPYRKYAEVIYDLAQKGYSVYTMDHRGQGQSGRMASPSDMGYVGTYRHYVEDLNEFVEKVVKSRLHARLYLFAHSMGAAVSTLYIDRYSPHFDAVVYSSPMFEINTGKYSNPVAYALATAGCVLGQGKHFALGKHGYDPDEKFEANEVTHSRARFTNYQNILNADLSLAIGGPSYRWVKKSLEATHAVHKVAGDFKLPVLILQASADKTVHLGGQNYFCAKAADCLIFRLEGAYHETLMESDSIRDRSMARALEFFAAH